MSLVLHGAALSPFVRKTRVFLDEKGLEYKSVHVDPNNQPEGFEKISPLRRIPVLEDGDQHIADSAVICAWMERKHPQPALYPEDDYEYARALWFEKYADYEVALNATFAVFRNRIVMPLIGQPCDEAKVARALEEKLPPLLDYLESQIEGRDWFAGDQFSIADIAIASQCVNLAHGGECIDAGKWPALARHVEKVHARPSFGKLIERENSFIQGLKK